MPTYIYKAKDKTGKLITGKRDADTKTQVAKFLSDSGCFILDIREERKTQKLTTISLFESKVKPKDIIVFTRQLATMLKAGLPFVDGLKALSKQVENKAMKEIIPSLEIDVSSGSSFSKALSKHPGVFPKLYISMVEAGEEGGVLDEILNRIVRIMETEEETKSRVKSAFTYPAIIVIIAIGVIGFLTTFVFPKFMGIFASANIALPLPTRILFGISSLVRGNLEIIIGGIFFAIIGFRAYRKTSIGRHLTDNLILKVPLVGNLIKKVILSRFTRTLATLYSSGVPILRALEIVEGSSGNVVISKIMRKVKDGVKAGKSLAAPMADAKIFPAMMVQMIATGEKTGAISEMLTEISTSYDVEVDYAIKAMTSAIEPILIVFMGVVVGLTALSLFLPMFDMMEIMR